MRLFSRSFIIAVLVFALGHDVSAASFALSGVVAEQPVPLFVSDDQTNVGFEIGGASSTQTWLLQIEDLGGRTPASIAVSPQWSVVRPGERIPLRLAKSPEGSFLRFVLIAP